MSGSQPLANSPRSQIVLSDNLDFLAGVPDGAYHLVYIDPPFNTGRPQSHARLRTVADAEGDRTGFGGRTYRTEAGRRRSYDDRYDDYLGFLEPRLREGRRELRGDGSFFLHIDYREAHYAKVLLDSIFGRECFMNEIIWAYDYGGRPKNRWPAKHDSIFWYAADPDDYTFNYGEMDRIPYMAPGLVTEDKARRGKTPTDVWWHTIVPTNGSERTGYPTQKPLGVLDRIIKVHSRAGDRVLDFFAGSGTAGEAAARRGRSFTLVDDNPEATQVMAQRLAFCAPKHVGFKSGPPMMVPASNT